MQAHANFAFNFFYYEIRLNAKQLAKNQKKKDRYYLIDFLYVLKAIIGLFHMFILFKSALQINRNQKPENFQQIKKIGTSNHRQVGKQVNK